MAAGTSEHQRLTRMAKQDRLIGHAGKDVSAQRRTVGCLCQP